MQFVGIGNSTSVIRETKMGVPQGSTMGPLLFILYISDMHRALSYMKIIHFADDSTLYIAYEKNIDCSIMINQELDSLNTWLLANKLFLNIDKTKFMIIHNQGTPRDLSLHIANDQILRANVHKFLGVEIDDCLTFTEHIKKINSKIAANIGIMRKIRCLVPQSVLRNLHFAFVNSRFVYALTSYGFAAPSATRKLSNLIDKSIKISLDVDRLTPEICKANKLFNFHLSLKLFSSIKMHQILNNNRHKYFCDKIHDFQSYHSHNTRSSNAGLLSRPFMRFSKCEKIFCIPGSGLLE